MSHYHETRNTAYENTDETFTNRSLRLNTKLQSKCMCNTVSVVAT